jgi:choice-of-anchor B domain-containing protein
MLPSLRFVLFASLLLPVAVSAHDDTEWDHDRQPPYVGPGWTAAAGGGPPVTFASAGVQLQSWLTLTDLDPSATAANDIWAYVSPSGREYALIGISNGTSVVEVTSPAAAQRVGSIAGPASSWRDIKTYQHYAYAVSEGGGGIQVIDLSQVDSGVVTLSGSVTTGGRAATHDVAVDAESGMLFRVGGGSSNDPPLGVRIYSLANPAVPALVGEWHGRYCHDAQALTWTEAPYAGVEVVFCFANDTTAGGDPGVEILDVSDPQNVAVIGSINLSLPPIFSHPALYSHQGWLSPDRRYLYVNDEVDEGSLGTTTLTRILDVQDLANPTQVATFTNGNSARDHNLFTLGNRIFEANYRSGLRIYSAFDPLAPFESGYFDTYPPDDDAHYNGLWGVYPFLPSGTVIGSDIEKGLFVWTVAAAVPAADAWGRVATVLLILAVSLRIAASSRRARTRTARIG